MHQMKLELNHQDHMKINQKLLLMNKALLNKVETEVAIQKVNSANNNYIQLMSQDLAVINSHFIIKVKDQDMEVKAIRNIHLIHLIIVHSEIIPMFLGSNSNIPQIRHIVIILKVFIAHQKLIINRINNNRDHSIILDNNNNNKLLIDLFLQIILVTNIKHLQEIVR
jgi:hypothetical protein